MRPFTARLALASLLSASFSCERRHEAIIPPSPPPSIAPAQQAQIPPAPLPMAAETFANAAQLVRQAVVLITVFNAGGNLKASGQGFFVSGDGIFITDSSVIAGGVNAVAKAANGAIHNVAGTVAQLPTQNCVLLKADAAGVPSLVASETAALVPGRKVALVLSPVERARTMLIEAEITERFNDRAGEGFETNPVLPKTALGAPVIDDHGEVVGIVTLREGGSCAIRSASIISALLSRAARDIAPWQSSATPTSSPVSPTPSATKIPAPAPPRASRLIYAPPPRYPQELKRAHWAKRGSGSYRITFDAQGRAINVQIIRSTGNAALDSVALSALRDWRAEPGQSWSLVVPITFQP